jgi:hypothetical protein
MYSTSGGASGGNGKKFFSNSVQKINIINAAAG